MVRPTGQALPAGPCVRGPRARPRRPGPPPGLQRAHSLTPAFRGQPIVRGPHSSCRRGRGCGHSGRGPVRVAAIRRFDLRGSRSSAERAALPAAARGPVSPGAGGNGTSIPAKRTSRPSSSTKLRPSMIADTFPAPAVSNWQALADAGSGPSAWESDTDPATNPAINRRAQPLISIAEPLNGAGLRRFGRPAHTNAAPRWSAFRLSLARFAGREINHFGRAVAALEVHGLAKRF